MTYDLVIRGGSVIDGTGSGRGSRAGVAAEQRGSAAAR